MNNCFRTSTSRIPLRRKMSLVSVGLVTLLSVLLWTRVQSTTSTSSSTHDPCLKNSESTLQTNAKTTPHVGSTYLFMIMGLAITTTSLYVLLGVLVLVLIAVAVALLVKLYLRRGHKCSSEPTTGTCTSDGGAQEPHQNGNCNGSNGTCKANVLFTQFSQKHEASTDKTAGAVALQVEQQSARQQKSRTGSSPEQTPATSS